MEMTTASGKLCLNLIDKGRTNGMAEKLSKLLLFDQINTVEYDYLMTLLK